MKKTIIIGMIILMSITVFALEYGDILTQEQIDNIDFDTVDLHITDLGYQNINNRWYKQIRVDTIKPVNGGYLYDNVTTHIGSVSNQDLKVCINAGYSLSDCRLWGRIQLDINQEKMEIGYRNKLSKLQTDNSLISLT